MLSYNFDMVVCCNEHAGKALTELLQERETAFDARFTKTFEAFAPATPKGGHLPDILSVQTCACASRTQSFVSRRDNIKNQWTPTYDIMPATHVRGKSLMTSSYGEC